MYANESGKWERVDRYVNKQFLKKANFELKKRAGRQKVNEGERRRNTQRFRLKEQNSKSEKEKNKHADIHGFV